MIRIAAHIKIKPAEFWDMTPSELTLYSEGYTESQIESIKQSIASAYYTAKLMRTKSIPDLDRLLKGLDGNKKRKKEKVQAPEEIAKLIKNTWGNM